ncbi:50S ribosomal protein L4 [Novosphingobium marinum]|uniref:Large ribosomal subunit protein uL4 n=1 Tax=Novosphingobium marinum TaxID=1514948 RepID=A0A7Y9XVD0_9SPHN|nr:50S ribosomal protein L4 [Novosphingobium marinum]NYH95306.1 large subunit ribosomal protein L4 [Novosphingobium marinum]GGC26009.1 50S ribosomal protein L4 [Novosphingobium marinum]
MKVKVLNLDGSAGKNDIELSDDVFGLEPRADILHRVVTWQLENRRGTARPTRERSDVARTGKKFGRQKGGGTARHGDRKAPIFVGGGKAHGARKREFEQSLNKKVRALGLKMALSAKAKDGLVVVDSLDVKDAKTKALAGQFKKAGWGRKVLVIDGEQVDQGFARAAGNLVDVNVLPAVGANVYDILKHDTLVLTRAAVEKLEARFALPGGSN